MIKFTLIENSLDSIELGLQHLTKANTDDNASAYKHSLLCLFHGAELILKEILVLIDPITIFDKNSLFKYCETPLKPKIEELYNCKSIDIHGICTELRKYYPEEFTTSSVKAFKDLARERNKVQHFAIEITPVDLLNQLLKLYIVLIKPAFKILIDNWSNNKSGRNEVVDTISERISAFEDSFLNIQMKDGFTRGSCVKCGEFTFFIVYDGESFPIHSYCTTCNYELKNIDISAYNECPECGGGSLIYDPDLGGGVCHWYKCSFCSQGELVEMEPCKTCQGYMVEKECINCTVEE